jgi:hypothetical protein
MHEIKIYLNIIWLIGCAKVMDNKHSLFGKATKPIPDNKIDGDKEIKVNLRVKYLINGWSHKNNKRMPNIITNT